jgi:FtsH-binding integral membrane protein
MNKIFSIYAIIGAIIAIYTIIYNNNSKKLTKSLYAINTYMYIILGILITSLCVLLLDLIQFDAFSDGNTKYYILSFIIALSIIITFAVSSENNVIFRNILFIAFTALLGVLTVPIYQSSVNNNIFHKSIITLIVIVMGLMGFAYYYPNSGINNWYGILITSLCVLIVFQLSDLLFGYNNNNQYMRQKIYATAGLIIFSGFLVYDTSKIYENADIAINCINRGGSVDTCTDYPAGSLGVYLDIMNLFSNLVNIHS